MNAEKRGDAVQILCMIVDEHGVLGKVHKRVVMRVHSGVPEPRGERARVRGEKPPATGRGRPSSKT